jgi:hypothetical protein
MRIEMYTASIAAAKDLTENSSSVRLANFMKRAS